MSEEFSIYWFRQDLRLSDNPALVAASNHGKVLPIYILDDINSGDYKLGSASRVWLHHSLKALNKSLHDDLSLYCGDPLTILLNICEAYPVKNIFWNRCYEPWQINRDAIIKEKLRAKGISIQSYNGSLLWEPWHVHKSDGSPYKVFTPFYRKGCLNAKSPREPLYPPDKLSTCCDKKFSVSLERLNLLPEKCWGLGIKSAWSMGEEAAQQCLDKFIDEGLQNYKDGRNFPNKKFVSRLSPHFHFGEISANQAWYSVKDICNDQNQDNFCSELGWREFSYYQLYFNQNLPIENLHKKFNDFPWKSDPVGLLAWQKGETGVPIVDAGMRELWQTGYIHNRVRMVAASFLVKNLCIDWRHGERWFWDCLVDADLASNSASWQWVAGCGADASPYFRIFNPVTQGQKFDSDGEYVRKYVPEIAKLPNKFLFSPWEAPLLVLKEAGVVLGDTYPKPIVDLKKSREYALAAFASLKKEQND
ncbi:MAG: deoxyribodipyrimidine photo-lyase [Legionellales bacterium]|jgi:deoxyribodipyrimidine photo-lyase|nr:deoxyribodipyrimidine photo-lyase [Legionellales bacterium]